MPTDRVRNPRLLIGIAVGIGICVFVALLLRSHSLMEFAEGHDKLLNVLGAICVAVFTGALVLVTALLYLSTEKAAVAAEGAATTAREALVKAQRAFVFLDSFDTQVLANQFLLSPKWRNSGSTPTRRMTNYVSWKAFQGEPPDDYQFPDLDSAGNPLAAGARPPTVTLFVGPQATQFADLLRIPTTTIDAAAQGQFRLFVWGWARYHDVFGGPHITRFCNEIKLQALSPEGTTKKAAATFPLYHRHNCTDEECATP